MIHQVYPIDGHSVINISAIHTIPQVSLFKNAMTRTLSPDVYEQMSIKNSTITSLETF
jgi:hypothetical protein